jgi:hypothetical protein
VAVLPLPPTFIPPAINAAVTTVATASAANKVVPLVVTTVGLKATLPILVGGAAILGTIALVGELAQIWSLFNQSQDSQTNWGGPVSESVTPDAVIEPSGDGSGVVFPVVEHWDTGGTAIPQTVPDNARVSAYFLFQPRTSTSFKGYSYRYEAVLPDGTVLSRAVLGPNMEPLDDGLGDFPELGPRLKVLYWTSSADEGTPLPISAPVLVPTPVSVPTFLPAETPATSPEPKPLPLTQPQPQAPGKVAPPTTATPTAPPATLPRTPAYPQPTPTQQPTPTGQETAPSGELVPLPLPLPTPTSPTAHVINGTQVPANGPAPTLTGIAQELGRLERKSAQMLDPSRAPTGPNIDRLGLLADLLGSLVEAVFFLQQGGQYELSSPCELTEAGDRVPVVVPFSGALSSFGVLSNKVDALAELLQAHKDLKQPICKQTPAIGEPVTVNFEQVN